MKHAVQKHVRTHKVQECLDQIELAIRNISKEASGKYCRHTEKNQQIIDAELNLERQIELAITNLQDDNSVVL